MQAKEKMKQLALAAALAGLCGGAEALTLHASSANLAAGTDATRPVSFDVTVDTLADLVTMKISGPADRWFGVAFGSEFVGMATGPYAIIASDAPSVFEQDLGGFNPGQAAPVGITVLSDTTLGNTRTINLTRGINATYSGAISDPDPYTFPSTQGAFIHMLWARSVSTTTFGYHGSSGPNSGHAALTLAAIPLPGAVVLFAPALAGLMWARRRPA